MNRPPRHRRKAWRKSKPSSAGYKPPWAGHFRLLDGPSVDLTRRDKIYLISLAVLASVTFVLLLHFLVSWESKKHLNDFIDSLRANYELSETQVIAIRKIEKEFHGMGGIFFSPSRGYEEKLAHQVEISQQMSPEAGARFLADLKRSSSVTQKQVH